MITRYVLPFLLLGLGRGAAAQLAARSCADRAHNQPELRGLIERMRTMTPADRHPHNERLICRNIPGYACDSTTQLNLPGALVTKAVTARDGSRGYLPFFELSLGFPGFAKLHLLYLHREFALRGDHMVDPGTDVVVGYVRADRAHVTAVFTTPYVQGAEHVVQDDADAPVMVDFEKTERPLQVERAFDCEMRPR